MLIDYSTKLKREIKDIKQQAEIDLKKACEIYEQRCRAVSNSVETNKNKQATRVEEIATWVNTTISKSQADDASIVADADVKKNKMKEEPLVSQFELAQKASEVPVKDQNHQIITY